VSGTTAAGPARAAPGPAGQPAVGPFSPEGAGAAGDEPRDAAAARPRRTREVLDALLLAILLATFARTFVVQAFRIPTASMEHNLVVGDHVLVNKFVFAPTRSEWERRLLPVRPVRRGDVVVFRFPPDPLRDFVKRCVGLPGDRLRLRAKRLFLNGVPRDEPYAHFADPRVLPNTPFLDEYTYFQQRDHMGPTMVPPEHYFVLGDNRDFSHDSRFWGTVPAEAIKGRAFLVYWSFRPPPEPAAGEPPRPQASSWLRTLVRTRWSRVLRLVR
jgi:signal peptidase I